MNREAFVAPTLEASYWLGFLIADGCVTRVSTLSVNIQLADGEHLEKLRRFLECEGNPVRREENRACVAFTVGRQMLRDMAEHGITRRKSATAVAGRQMAQNPAFWRGAIDGDGEIYILAEKTRRGLTLGTPRVCFNGSLQMCKQFVDFCNTRIGYQPKVIPVSTIWRAYLNGVNAYRMLEILYPSGLGLSMCSLDRKRAIAEHILDGFAYRYKSTPGRNRTCAPRSATWRSSPELRAQKS